MYSGCVVIYGVQLTACDIEMTLGLKPPTFQNGSQHDYTDEINQWMCDKGYILQCDHLRCCAFHNDRMFYIGINLGEITTAYRSSVCNHESFEHFFTEMSSMIADTKRVYAKNKTRVKKELERVFPGVPIKVYTFANDCESCT